MGTPDREINLEYTCADCGKACNVVSEERLFDIVNTQIAAENRELLCDDCND